MSVRTLALSASLSSLTLLAGTATGQVTILPAVDGGGARAWALNDLGIVAGETTPNTFPSNRSAAMWTSSVLGLLPSPASAPSGGSQGNSVFGLSNHGVAVGLAAWPTSSSNFAAHAARWDNGVATDLGAFPGAMITVARSVNSAGEVAGSATGGFGDPTTALRWTNSGTRFALDRLPTHTDSYAWKINASGRIVGSSGIVDGDFQPVRSAVYWDGTGVTALSTPAGYNQGEARGINDAGAIVGSSAFFDEVDTYSYTAYRATVWNSDVPQLLPLLSGFTASDAFGVNAGGLIIGAVYSNTYDAPYGLDGVPVLWSASGITDLRTLLAPAFPAGSNFTLTDINAANQISGYSVGPAGAQAFVLTVPTPGAAGVLGLAGLVAARRRRGACVG